MGQAGPDISPCVLGITCRSEDSEKDLTYIHVFVLGGGVFHFKYGDTFQEMTPRPVGVWDRFVCMCVCLSIWGFG